MKKKHKFNDELENFLIFLTEDELMEWFQQNEIEYERPLLELILEEKRKLENR